MNALKTTILLALLTGILVAAGQALGGREGAWLALVFAAVLNFGSYWFSDKIVLSMYKAVPVDQVNDPQARRLQTIVERLVVKAGLPMPKMYLIPDASLNAFATGRDPSHAAVAATAGILQALDDQELEGVMAHELSHVRHRDILTSSIVATIAGAISMLANMAHWALIFGGGRRDDDRGGSGGLGMLLTMILAPITATLIQLAISRGREFEADAGGARITQQPLALASALRKLEEFAQRRPLAAATPATAHLFIVNPLRGGGIAKLFSTHPPMADRVARLEAMATGGIR